MIHKFLVVLLLSSTPVYAASFTKPLGEFIASQKIGTGISFSPLDVDDMDTRSITYIKGIGFGEKGLSRIVRNRKGAKTYMDLDYGGTWKGTEKRFELLFNLHPGNIGEKLWRRLPMADRWSFPKVPKELVGGPQLRLPLPGENRKWTIKNGFRLVVAWEFD